MKKILFSINNFFPIIGGGVLSIHDIINNIAFNYKVYVIYNGDKLPLYKKNNTIKYISKKLPSISGQWIKIVLYNIIWYFVLKKNIKKIKPDIVITQLDLTISSVFAAKKNNLQTIIFSRGTDYFTLGGYKQKGNLVNKLKWVFQYPFYFFMKPFFIFAYKISSKVVSNSNYISKELKEKWDINSKVIYPKIDFKGLDIQRTKKKKKYITLITPQIHKGVEIVIELAKSFKKECFLLVGKMDLSTTKKIKRINNIKHIPWSNDIGRILVETKILLVPSQIPEAFGRIIIEAIYLGTPVIASKIGGIPEIILFNKSLIKNYSDFFSWNKRLKLFLSNELIKTNSIKKNSEILINSNLYNQNIHLKRILEGLL